MSADAHVTHVWCPWSSSHAVMPVQVSFGEMIACDNPDCAIEWFHFECVGLDPNQSRPRGKKWYCNDCAAAMKPGRRR